MLEKITTVLKEYKDDANLVITSETTFADLALDSLDIVELVMNLEDEFNVTLEMSDSVKSVGDLMKMIEEA